MKNTWWDKAGWDAAFKSDAYYGSADCHEDRKHHKGGWCEECYDTVRVSLSAGWNTCTKCEVKYVPSKTSDPHKCGICAPLKHKSREAQ